MSMDNRFWSLKHDFNNDVFLKLFSVVNLNGLSMHEVHDAFRVDSLLSRGAQA